MHIPDGVLHPGVCAATGALSLAAVGYSLRQLKDSLTDRIVPLTAMMAAFLFAAQMVNFPIPGLPVSGHLLGGVLAAAILGPWAGCIALLLVLIVQCAVFTDGGLLALGSNTLHISVIGSLGGYCVYATVRRWLGDQPRSTVIAAVIASWLSVMAAAFFFCLEFYLSHANSNLEMRRIFALMAVLHSAIGIGEALITGAALQFIQQQRPDLIYQPGESSRTAITGRTLAAGMIVALAIAAFAAPFASSRPDGLEAVARQTHFDNLEQPHSAIFTDYQAPLPAGLPAWQHTSVAVAGIGGTLAVFCLAFLFGRVVRRPTSIELPHE
jgi:cobalt/nickel transport system permease protein